MTIEKELVVPDRHPRDVDIARLPAIAMAPEDVGEADADAEGLARRAARQDRFGARQARVLAARKDDPARKRHRIIIIVGPGTAVDEEGLAIQLAAPVDENEAHGSAYSREKEGHE